MEAASPMLQPWRPLPPASTIAVALPPRVPSLRACHQQPPSAGFLLRSGGASPAPRSRRGPQPLLPLDLGLAGGRRRCPPPVAHPPSAVEVQLPVLLHRCSRGHPLHRQHPLSGRPAAGGGLKLQLEEVSTCSLPRLPLPPRSTTYTRCCGNHPHHCPLPMRATTSSHPLDVGTEAGPCRGSSSSTTHSWFPCRLYTPPTTPSSPRLFSCLLASVVQDDLKRLQRKNKMQKFKDEI
ncbi:atherin isoform X4 [Triticum aestivum]|uniref:atherin isoform X4 n=1 Tax=Triticum aestivum TaxID=4565 RepID=UPI001D016B7F|nr:atherin-like isoform X4 [Triticum aestivum]